MATRILVFLSTVALLAGAVVVSAAQSQPASTPGSRSEQQRIQIVPLSAEELYQGWRASQLLGKRITSATGSDLGTVRNLTLGKDGRITAVIVEGNKSTQLREFMFRIPWQRVQASKVPDRLIADITAGSDPAYGIFRAASQHSPEEFAITEITGDYARLQAGQGYGYVSDAVFTRAGNLIAVLITRDFKAGGGTYAFGFPENAMEQWNAGATYYGLPYASSEHADAAGLRVDFTRFRNNSETGPG